nr:MAG TPA: hypothetical protein [Caudoviricetes sp.]DAN63497.1 MAG TPA: hypothetical protein [Caudoviricetes sp.]
MYNTDSFYFSLLKIFYTLLVKVLVLRVRSITGHKHENMNETDGNLDKELGSSILMGQDN